MSKTKVEEPVNYITIVRDILRDSHEPLEENHILQQITGPQYDALMEVCHYTSEHHINPDDITYREDEEYCHFEFPNEKTDDDGKFCMTFPLREMEDGVEKDTNV